MQHRPHIAFIDANAECGGGDHDRKFIICPSLDQLFSTHSRCQPRERPNIVQPLFA